MSYRKWAVPILGLALLAAACGDSGGEELVTTDVATNVTEAPITTQPGNTSAPVDQAALTIDLMDSADLPADIPVPVPDGGVEAEVSAFEGQSFAVDYPPGSMARMAAFYDAWFADQGIGVEPSFGSDDQRLWRVEVAGIPVEVELYPLTTGEADQLFISWP
jgi:hypothetical protein